MKTGLFLLMLGLLLAHSQQALGTSQHQQNDIIIDGKETTIGLASAYYLRGLMTTLEIFSKIVKILIPATPDEDSDYFDLIRGDVEQVVGDYIDQHNMDQLLIYKSDLGVLLQRYMEAPKESSSYPDKNTVANSLSTSIIANRFLVEAGERPQSMIIHFADIASIHISVLKDVAETYSESKVVSQWWVDLNDQLAHYIDHGRKLQDNMVDWRNDMMLCEYDEGRYYDTWTVTDQVTNINDVCTQVHDTHSCDNHCQAYQINMNREVSVFIWHYMGKSVREWELLKIKAAQLAARAQS
ncbi:uncharacterized protein LOC121874651 [Homarus americanus]|uniref:uncharacterized protein LOC121874651 n=1 Tax=Homarus americanus TaxID=6706 RepID=UPI001C49106D|nr:uncharacterized protein LOC121874651 [Homarus americanus]